MKPTRAQIKELQKREEKKLLQSFNQILSNIKNQAVLFEIVKALELNNIGAVIELLGLNEASWSGMESAIRDAYHTGGITGAAQLGKIPINSGMITFRYNARAIAAERWVREKSSQLIVNIISTQRDAIRDTIERNLALGNGPRATALDLVGRINPVTKRRQGGVVGLTQQQAGWINNARRDLHLIGASPAQVSDYFLKIRQPIPANYNPYESYFSRKLRDKRFDSAVIKANTKKEPLKSAQINNAIAKMQTRAERYRGEVIARTESINALRAGQWQAIDQAVETGEIEPQDAIKVWDSSQDGREREAHGQAHGQSVRIDQAFFVDGEQLMFPGDNSLGASAENIIQCRCSVIYELNFLGIASRIEGFG